MKEYKNISNVPLVVVIDNKLKVIAPGEIIKANRVVYTSNLIELSPPVTQTRKKVKKNANKADN